MKCRALKGFVGIISMSKGEVRELDGKNIHVKDLLKAKFIEEVKPEKKPEKK